MKTRIAVAAIMAIAVAGSAHAQTMTPRNSAVLPPLEYDHPYQGELIVTVVGKEHMAVMCPKTSLMIALGCTRLGPAAGLPEGTCQIILANDEIIKAAGWSTKIVRRHEESHRGGWPAHHPGARPATADDWND